MDGAHPVARAVAADMAKKGSEAVVLVGSHARADAGPDSDLDILAVGPEEFSFRLERRGGFLVSTGSRPVEAHRRSFRDPGSVGTAVPGWREAVVLHDPDGVAAALVGEAEAWRWGPLEESCDRYVAESVTALAEEVHKLAAASRAGNLTGAAAQRSLLALHLAPVLAVHRRILYGSENGLWEAVSDAMGEEWRHAQRAAMGLNGEAFGMTCGAALTLYRLAAEEVRDLLDSRQDGVVRHARELAGSPEAGG